VYILVVSYREFSTTPSSRSSYIPANRGYRYSALRIAGVTRVNGIYMHSQVQRGDAYIEAVETI